MFKTCYFVIMLCCMVCCSSSSNDPKDKKQAGKLYESEQKIESKFDELFDLLNVYKTDLSHENMLSKQRLAFSSIDVIRGSIKTIKTTFTDIVKGKGTTVVEPFSNRIYLLLQKLLLNMISDGVNYKEISVELYKLKEAIEDIQINMNEIISTARFNKKIDEDDIIDFQDQLAKLFRLFSKYKKIVTGKSIILTCIRNFVDEFLQEIKKFEMNAEQIFNDATIVDKHIKIGKAYEKFDNDLISILLKWFEKVTKEMIDGFFSKIPKDLLIEALSLSTDELEKL